jgi:hypothetical protein
MACEKCEGNGVDCCEEAKAQQLAHQEEADRLKEERLEAERKAAEEDPSPGEEDPGEEEMVVSVDGEEDDPEKNEGTGLVKHLRKIQKETAKTAKTQAKEIEELKRQIAEKSGESEELGPKPTFDTYNESEDEFTARFEVWHEKKARIGQNQSAQKKEQETNEATWQETLKTYDSGKEELAQSLPDFEESEGLVEAMLDETQLGIIKHAVKDAAKVIYQLGRLPEQIKKLSEITDPVKFTYEIALLVPRLKMEKKRPATKPEETVGGSGRPSAGIDRVLEKLEKEAARTGDRTKIIEHKRKLKKE